MIAIAAFVFMPFGQERSMVVMVGVIASWSIAPARFPAGRWRPSGRSSHGF